MTTEARAPKARKQDPEYDVFEVVTIDHPNPDLSGEPVEVLLPLAAGVKATNDREAIKRTVADRAPEAQAGTFRGCVAGELRERRRSVQVQPVDTWS